MSSDVKIVGEGVVCFGCFLNVRFVVRSLKFRFVVYFQD